MSGELVIEVRSGSGEPMGIRLTPGKSAGPIEIGAQGLWRVVAAGVAARHAYLFFDGRRLLVRSVDAARPALAGGRPVPCDWMAVEPGCEIALGAAMLWFGPPAEDIDWVTADEMVAGEGDAPGDIVDESTADKPLAMFPPAAPPAAGAETTRLVPIQDLMGAAQRRAEAAGGPQSARALFDTTTHRLDPSPTSGRIDPPTASIPGVPPPRPSARGVPEAPPSIPGAPPPLPRSSARGALEVAPTVAAAPPPRSSVRGLEGPPSVTGMTPPSAHADLDAPTALRQPAPHLPPLAAGRGGEGGSFAPDASGSGPSRGAQASAPIGFTLDRASATLSAKWRQLSFPQKALAILLAPAILSAVVIFADPGARGRSARTRPPAASASTSSPPAATVTTVEEPLALDDDEPEAPIAPSAAAPPGAPHAAPAAKTLERRAVDAVAAGDYEQAARLYDELSTSHPDVKAYAAAAAIARAKARHSR